MKKLFMLTLMAIVISSCGKDYDKLESEFFKWGGDKSIESPIDIETWRELAERHVDERFSNHFITFDESEIAKKKIYKEFSRGRQINYKNYLASFTASDLETSYQLEQYQAGLKKINDFVDLLTDSYNKCLTRYYELDYLASMINFFRETCIQNLKSQLKEFPDRKTELFIINYPIFYWLNESTIKNYQERSFVKSLKYNDYKIYYEPAIFFCRDSEFEDCIDLRFMNAINTWEGEAIPGYQN